MTKKPKIICILGITASGKTDLAINLAQRFPIDIISVDSAMVYRNMDIGTAKPTKQQQALAPHRLIDICDPAENYSAGQFCLDAHREINAIIAAGRVPLLVGGTMLYFNLLQKGFHQFPGANAAVRESIDLEAEKIGWAAMHKKLVKYDPDSAKSIHPNDSQRIQRALEVLYATGSTMTTVQQQQKWITPAFETINIIIAPKDRSLIHQRIEKRFEAMLENGLLKEAELLYQRGDLNENMPSMRMVGYRQLWRYFAGSYRYEEMRERAIIATRQFAKRQYTWLNQWPDEVRYDRPTDSLPTLEAIDYSSVYE